MDIINQYISQYIWTVPVALALIAVYQILYLIWLAKAPTRKETPRPTSPIMPSIGAPMRESLAPVPQQVQRPAPMMDAGRTVAAAPALAAQNFARPTESVGKLIVMGGLKDRSEIALPSENFSVGRFYNPGNNILIAMDEKSVSRKHANFICDERIREYYLVDTHSSFGTFIMLNGFFEQLPPNKQERIYNEDIVRFGNAVTVRLVLPCETRAAMTRL
ncbi:MAG: FHA domain-containing protein [Burkholderiales bacterium]|nr:FHA domain-containing protein [Anaerolineae bacterium]